MATARSGEGAPALVLASGSFIRRNLLRAAGIRFEVDPPEVDEAAWSEPDPRRRAADLAAAKARDVSSRRPGRLVLGSDQVMSVDGRPMAKPEDDDELMEHLRRLNGRAHDFSCGVCLVRDGETVFACVEEATVTFLDCRDEELEAYARTREGLGCAGGYRLEEGGVRLIESIRGSHFTVLGLPMPRLVRALRELGLSPAIYEEREIR